MRFTIVLVLAASGVLPSLGQETIHRYGPDDRYAGCLFGDMVPLLRRGYSRDRALAVASRRCESLSVGLTKQQVEEAATYVNFSIDVMER